jgi:proteasome lid subunit RPN8/RPN11
MSLQPIAIPRPLVNQILHHAQAASTLEVCGLIGARDGIPTTCYPLDNVSEQAETRFAPDPGQQVEAMRTLRERGETLFAIFHSHPAAPALPSASDREQLGYPETLYLIVSLNTKGVLEMRGFRLEEGRQFAEIPLCLA